MSGGKKIAIGVGIVIVLGAAGAGLLLIKRRPQIPATQTITITGVVLAQDSDPRKQLPIANAKITASINSASVEGGSDPSGFFNLQLRINVPITRTSIPPPPPVLDLSFQHGDYRDLQMNEPADGRLYVVHMTPIPQQTRTTANHSQTTLSNIRVRYSVRIPFVEDVGFIADTFEAANKGNVPCDNNAPCSPDHKWKATITPFKKDAGAGKLFHDVRISCIAGPCPFTKQLQETPQDVPEIQVSILNWSDTTTFLVEAEYTQAHMSDMARESYAVVFGEALNFALPAGAEGLTIVADTNGTEIVYPLGPDLIVSWGVCTAKVAPDHSTLYRCEAKPGYHFRPSE